MRFAQTGQKLVQHVAEEVHTVGEAQRRKASAFTHSQFGVKK